MLPSIYLLWFSYGEAWFLLHRQQGYLSVDAAQQAALDHARNVYREQPEYRPETLAWKSSAAGEWTATHCQLEYHVAPLELVGGTEPYSRSVTWNVRDVLTVCPHLTEDQAAQVLDAVVDKHDADVGINWDTFYNTAGHLFGYPSSDDEDENEEDEA